MYVQFTFLCPELYSPVPNNRGGVLIKGGGLTDHLNINKRGAKIKGEGGGVAENCSQSKVETSSY